jgi:oligoendopeptidase F
MGVSAQAVLPAASDAVDVADTWNLDDVYPSLEDWEVALAAVQPRIEGLRDCAGRLEADLLGCTQRSTEVVKELSRLSTYASNHAAGNNRDAEWRGRSGRVSLLWTQLGEATAWWDPELLALGEKKVAKVRAKAPELEGWGYSLDNVFRDAVHTRSPEVEALLASTGPLRHAPGQIYRVLLNAETEWPTVTLSDGAEVVVDPSAFVHHRSSPIRADREAVFAAAFGTTAKVQGTVGAALGATAQSHWFTAQARGYESCVAAAIAHDHIPPEVYATLVARTRANLGTLHRYLRLRARLMGLETLKYSDLYPPLVELEGLSFPLERGKQLTIDSAAPLGEAYTSVLEEGFANRWMDVYPRPGKSPGAYMDNGAYDVHPLVLMNYTDDYNAVSTLAHEWGHAVHTALATEAQPYQTSNYATFTAEIASTLAEALLLEHMLEQAKTDEERLYYLGHALEKLRTTYFRQALFAEFELALHEMVEEGEPVTGEALSSLYLSMLRDYYGHEEGVTNIGDAEGAEWISVRHFHYNFYVYQYATSLAGV